MANKRLTVKSFYFSILKEYKWQFLIMQIAMLSWSFQEALSPYFIKRILDIISDPSIEKEKIFISHRTFFIVSVSIYLLIELGYKIHEYVALKFYPILKRDIRIKVFEYVLGHSHDYFSENYSGTIGNKIARLADAMHDISEKIITLFVPILTALAITTYFLFEASHYLGIAIIIWFTCFTVIFLTQAPKSQILSERHSDQVTFLNGRIIDVLNNIFTVRLFARTRFEIEKLIEDNKKEIKAYNKYNLFNLKLNIALALVTIAFVLYMVFGGIILWQKSLISFSELVLSISSLYIVGLVWYLSMNLLPFYDQLGISNDALELLRVKHQIAEQLNSKPLRILEGKIEFIDVSFKYSNNQQILKGCNLVIPGNQKIGLVGLSGSGKTTFSNLIMRIYDVTSGKILIDGQNIQNVSLDSLREQISYIPQDLNLFHRTILENIWYGNLNATKEQVIEASKLAQAHDFITKLPEGYDTQVGERGVKLSGGQRQRIAIARAILKDSKIIIMDEATSALDLITEYEIQKNLYYNISNKTLIVIAHRISTLKDMNRILVFKRGEIVEDGTHEELLNKNSHYKELWNKQLKQT